MAITKLSVAQLEKNFHWPKHNLTKIPGEAKTENNEIRKTEKSVQQLLQKNARHNAPNFQEEVNGNQSSDKIVKLKYIPVHLRNQKIFWRLDHELSP